MITRTYLHWEILLANGLCHLVQQRVHLQTLREGAPVHLLNVERKSLPQRTPQQFASAYIIFTHHTHEYTMRAMEKKAQFDHIRLCISHWSHLMLIPYKITCVGAKPESKSIILVHSPPEIDILSIYGLLYALILYLMSSKSQGSYLRCEDSLPSFFPRAS